MRAIDLLDRALAREYEPRSVEALADLHEGLRHYDVAMEIVGDALARDGPRFDHAALHERLAGLRRRLAPREAGGVQARSKVELA
jgi:hypothetical protein